MKNVIEKFDPNRHAHLLENLNFSFFSHISYADCFAYILKREHGDVLVTQDVYNFHDFPALFLPKEKKNWIGMSAVFLSKADLEKVKKEVPRINVEVFVGHEYYYSTRDFINLKNRKVRERVRQFERLYTYKLLHEYSEEGIKKFYERWKKQRSRDGVTFCESENAFKFHLDNLEKYKIRQVYIEIDGNLEGLGWGIPFDEHNNSWIGLELKVNYDIKGLSRFLHYERAKMFDGFDEFTLGTGAKEEGIITYKDELGPIRKKEYYYLLT